MYGFRTLFDVKQHIIRLHRITCHICNAVFYRKKNLEVHINHVHLGVPWLPPQIGGAISIDPDFSGKNFDAYKTRTKHNRLGLTETSYTLKFKNLNKIGINDSITAQIKYLKKMLQAIIKAFKKRLSNADTAQLILYAHPENIKSTFSTPFLQKNDFTYTYITNRIAELLNSNENFRIDNEMFIDIKIVKTIAGSVLSLKAASNVINMLFRKRSVMLNNCDDNLCYARALLLAYYNFKLKKKLITKTFWLRITNKNNPFMKNRAEWLQSAAGMSQNTQVSIKDAKKFYKCFKNFQINIYWLNSSKIQILHSGKNNNSDSLNVFYYDNHFYPIIKLNAFKGIHYVCQYCNYTSAKHQLLHHVCKAKCYFCHARNNHACYLTDCSKIDDVLYKCQDCSQTFYSELCYKQHRVKRYSYKTKSVCDIFKRCDECMKIHNINSRCAMHNYCEFCQTRKYKNHDCYINPGLPTETFKKYLVYDIESRLERINHEDTSIHTKHIPNLICSRLLCDACLTDDFATECGLCEFMVFKEDLCVRNFIEYVTTMKNVAVIGHNSSRYDHILLFSEIIHTCANHTPTVVPCGNSLLSMSIGSGIVFRDSNLFFKSRLAKLPVFFGFKNSPVRRRSINGTVSIINDNHQFAKGQYPYTFNQKANYNYTGVLPDIHYYNTQNMSESEKADFLKWYNTMLTNNVVFDFWDELTKYCLNDVNLLSQALNIYRKSNIKYHIEPFDSVTVAQLTYRIFTNNFLQPNQIVRQPIRRNNSSIKCSNWLSYYETVNNVSLIREFRIPGTNYRADGYMADQKHILEFLGCYFHGHNIHFLSTDILSGGRTASELYNTTLQRINVIRKLGYKVTTIWECDYDLITQEKPENFQFLPETLTIRSALYGGRCEVFSVYNDYSLQNRYGRSIDIVSLYPSCMVNRDFPIGKPVFIDKNDIPLPFNIGDYFGTVSCEVIPPEKLYLPVLPYKTKLGGKLTFPLCKECVEHQLLRCTHFGQRCRNLIGCWTTVELELAIHEGYKIVQVYQICNFAERSNTLFKSFILHMLKGKLEASGYPKTVTTENDKHSYIQTIKNNTGIVLTPANIAFNPAVRNYYKVKLVSLWGKFAQNPGNKTQMEVVKDSKTLMNFNAKILARKIIVKNMYTLPRTGSSSECDEAILIDYKKTKQHITVPFSSNPILASFVTAYGRIKLYETLKLIGDNSLTYCDTDSAYYSEKSNEITSKLDIGSNLGQMQDELSPGNYITTQICLAPKTYGYQTKFPEKGDVLQVVRNKGFGSEITDKINIKSFISLYHDKNSYISTENNNFFLRNRKDGTIFMKKLCKKFNYNYDKRIVVSDNITIPWGYKREP